MARKANNIVPVQQVESLIYLLRGQKVMLDSDLAALYGVATKVLNQAVRRNKDRFPEDFMFRLSEDEVDRILRSQTVTSSSDLRSQFVTSSLKHGGRRHFPFVFTEQGIAMLSSVLRSQFSISSDALSPAGAVVDPLSESSARLFGKRTELNEIAPFPPPKIVSPLALSIL